MIERHMACALKEGKLVYIDDVERGLKCGCTCPACGEALIARKGTSGSTISRIKRENAQLGWRHRCT